MQSYGSIEQPFCTVEYFINIPLTFLLFAFSTIAV